MVYDSKFNDSTGSIRLIGGVKAISTPTNLEENTMTGQSLQMDFANAPESTTAPATAPAAKSTDINVVTGGKRLLKQFIGTGNAKLGNHWLLADHSDKARIFYVHGEPHSLRQRIERCPGSRRWRTCCPR